MASTRSPGSRSSVLLLLLAGPLTRPPVVGALLGAAAPATAGTQATKSLSPFPAIYSPNPPDYDVYQLKFTYLGPQKKDVPSLAVVGPARAYTENLFVPYERGFDYGNDEFTGDTLLMAGPELMNFVSAIATVPALTDTALIAEPNMSLMILRDFGPAEVCWEHLATRGETDTLFQKLRDQVLNPADTLKVSSYRRQMAGVRR